jgi:hypothetical protein
LVASWLRNWNIGWLVDVDIEIEVEMEEMLEMVMMRKEFIKCSEHSFIQTFYLQMVKIHHRLRILFRIGTYAFTIRLCCISVEIDELGFGFGLG